MANEFIIRKGYKSLAASEVTGSLRITGDTYAAKFRLGNTQLYPSGDNNHIHFIGTALIGSSTTASSNPKIGTSAYPFSQVNAGYLYASNGSASSPSVSFMGFTDDGIYREVYDSDKTQISFATEGTRRVRIFSAGIWSDANVYATSQFRSFANPWYATAGTSGAGFKFDNTADSRTLLDITGAGVVTIGTLTSSKTGNLIVNHEGGVTPVAKFMSRTNKAIVQISDNDTTGYVSSENGLFSLGRNAGVNANNININAGNSVGMGTSNPLQKLHVVGSQIRLDTPAGGYYLYNSSGNFRAAFYDNGTDTHIYADGDGSNAALTFSNGNTTFGGSTTTTKVNINQAADEQGLEIKGYDDHSSSDIKLQINSSGHARLSQTTDGGSGYLFLQAENYLQLIAGTFTYTTSTFRVYDNTEMQFGSSGDYKIKHNTGNDNLIIHTNDNKGITIDNAGNTTFTENVVIQGTLTAQEFNTELVSASILFESGSTILGNSNDDTHDVTGTLNLTSSAANTILNIGNSGTGGINWGIYSANSSSPQAVSSGDLIFRNGSSNVFILQNSLQANFYGHVNLVDNKYLMWGGNAILQHTGAATNIGDNSSGTALVLSGGNARFAGNIGLGGATSPNRLLHIDNTSNTTKAAAYFYTNGVHTGVTTQSHFAIYSDNASSTGTLMFGRSDGSGYLLHLKNGATDRLIISNTGNATFSGIVGMGSTGIYAGTNAQLNLPGRGLAIKNDKNGSNNNWSYIENTASGSSSNINFYTGNNAAALTLAHNGDATFSGDIKQSTRIVLQDNGTIQWGSGADYGNLTWDTGYALIYGQSGKGIKFGTNGSTLALELDTSQNATFASDVKIDGSFKWATTNATSYTYSNADASGLYIETAGSTAALSDMRFQARAAGTGNYSYIKIKPSNQSILLGTNGADRLTIDSSGNATFAGTVSAKRQLSVVDTDSTTTHIKAFSNATEGVLTLSNGSNWGFIARGPGNDPRIGAYHGGTLKIEGFHSSDGSTGANSHDFAQFQFGNDHFQMNAATSTFAGIVAVTSGKSFRLYNAASNGWGELTLNETANKIQFNRGIQPSGDNQSDQLLGTSSNRWYQVHAGAFYGDGSNLTNISATDSTKLPLAGGTMTGDINLGSGAASIKKTANTSGNYPAIELYSSGTSDSGAAIAIQQATNEGDTIIFADYEPHVEWGISAENNSNEIHFTAGSSTNSLGSKTFKSNAGNDRTAYKKMIVNLSSGNVSVGGLLQVSGGTKLGGGSLQVSTDSSFNTNYNYTFRDAVGITNPNSTSFAVSSNTVMAIGARSGGTLNTSLITTGAVAIGKNAPTYTLDVAGDIGTDRYIRHNGDTNTYFGFSDADTIQFNTGGSERLRINSSGNVGIGTTSPTNTDFGSIVPRLHVVNTATTGAFNLVARFQAGGDANDTGGAILINHSNDRGLLIEAGRGGSGTAADDDAISHLGLVQSNGTNNRIITLRQNNSAASAAYNVGIGTTEPFQKLDVIGVGAFSGGAVKNITDAHNAGIFLSTANRGLSGNFSGYARNLISSIGSGIIEIGQASSLVNEIRLKAGSTANNGIVTFHTKAVEKMRLSADGYLGIGTTNPTSMLTLESASSPGIKIKDTTNAVTLLAYSQDSDAHLGTYSNHPLLFDTNSTTKMRITSGGDVGIGLDPTCRLDVENGALGGTTGDTNVVAKFRAGRQNFRFQDTRTATGTDWKDATFKLIAQIDSTDHQSIDFVNDSNYLEHIDLRTGNQVFNTRFTAGGNVGIATNDPHSRLQVGSPMARNVLTIGGLYSAGGAALNFRSGHPNNSSVWNMGEINVTDDGNYNGRIEFKTTTSGGNSGTTPSIKMVLKATGLLGLGTTAPVYPLDIQRGTEIQARFVGSQTGHTQGAILLSSGTADTPQARGQGVYRFNEGNDETWYTGTAYANADKYIWARKGSTTSFDSGTAQLTYAFMTLTNTGLLGLGTTSPGAQLHNYSTATKNVWLSGYGTAAQNDWQAGHAIFANAGNGLLISKANANNNTNRLYSLYNDASGNAEFYMYDTSQNNNVKFDTTGVSYLLGGNFGIGTSSPTYKLQVQGTGYFNETLYVNGQTTINANLVVDEGIIGNSKNFATREGWVTGTGSKTGWFGGSFNSSAEGNVKYEVGPFGSRELVMETVPDSGNDYDGGWNKQITGLDINKIHMSVIYVKRVGSSASGNFYHGTGTGTNQIVNVNNNVSNGNPYYVATGVSVLPQDVWCVSIGFIQANDDSETSPSYATAGIYRLDTGQKLAGASTYKFGSAGATLSQGHRTFLYYSTDNATKLQLARPGFFECNGDEPTFQELVGRPTAVLINSSGAPTLASGVTQAEMQTALGAAADSAVVHLAGAETITGNKYFSNTGNQFNGHIYFNAYDAAGNHYPHFRDGSDNGGTTVNWRQYYGSSYKTHTWASDSSGNMTFTYQGAITAAGTLTGTSLDINGNAHISSQVTIDASGATDNYYMRFQEGGADRFYIYENSNNVYFNGGPGHTHFRPRQNGGTGNFVISGADFQTSANIQLGQYNTINWGSSTSNQLTIQNYLSGAGIVQKGSGNLEFQANTNDIVLKPAATERLRVHNGGNNGGIIIKGGSANWNETTPGTGEGAIHLDPESGTDHFGSAITFGASDHSSGTVADAGIYVRSDGSYGTKMYFATTDSYAVGSKTRMFIGHNGNVGIGTTSPDEKLEVVGNIKHTGLTMTSGTDVDQVYSVNATYQLSANTWTDTGINGSELATGTYAIQLFVDDHSAGGGHYDVVYSGMMSWYGSNTNNGNFDEIVLHRVGHATNSSIVQLRTLMHVGAGDNVMLQVKQNFSHSTTMSGTTDGRRHNFKFRRLI